MLIIEKILKLNKIYSFFLLKDCVRFPYIAYKNGGGAFLVPYFLFLTLIGIPMMYMEMSISQFFQVGNIKLWQLVNPYMKGIGYGINFSLNFKNYNQF